MISTSPTRVAAVLLCMGIAACRPPGTPEGAPDPQTMREIPVYEIAPRADTGVIIAPSRARDPLADIGATKRITLHANNASARTLLLSLAREAGISIIVSPDVTTRVSVNFNDVPAGEAIRAIISEAGLSLLTSGVQSPWPPVVFYQLPVNINEISAETIVARFGVTAEMAKWLVENRPRP
jgi:hypothetical protein